MLSSAALFVPAYGYTYRFSGVTSIRHTLSLRVASDNESSADVSLVNGARLQPNKITLSVLETDVGNGAGRASRMLEALNALRRSRTLCTLSTGMATYSSLLLSEISVVQDDRLSGGWTGTLTFTEASGSGGKSVDNASAVSSSGAAAPTALSSASAVREVFSRAGVLY